MITGQELYNALKGATAFACKAAREKGRILILGDQGVNRSATLSVNNLHFTLELIVELQ